MEFFRAGVQYGDWKGTVAADNSDFEGIHKYLEGKGLVKEDEFLIAAELYAGENHVSVRAFLFDGPEGLEAVRDAIAEIDGPVPVQVVDLKLSSKQFFDLFKRFNVMLLSRGLQETIEDREYSDTTEE